ALADIIVGIALEIHVQATGIPDAKTLPGRTRQPQHDRRIGHAEIAVTFGDFTGQARTDRTIAIADIETEFATGFAFDCRLRRCPYFPGFGRSIEWSIRCRMTELGLAFRLLVFPKNRRQS